jgi:ABC-2 type transport system permease protein/lipopolysaccharide transport system permease protein
VENAPLELRETVGHAPLAWSRRLSPLRLLAVLGEDISELYRSRFVLRNLVSTQLKVRYRRSSLGFLWALLHPVLMLGVLSFIFSRIMRLQIDEYALYLFSGLIPWQFFSASIENGSRSLLDGEYLIRKVRVQKLIFPLACVTVAAINMFFAFGALFVLFQFLGGSIHPQLVLVPVGVVLLGLFSFGMGLITMTVVVRFRDTEHMITVILQALYFVSPVLYKPSMLGERAMSLMALNPLTHFLAFFHAGVYDGVWLPAGTWAAAVLWTLGSLIAGYTVYKANEHEYIFRL